MAVAEIAVREPDFLGPEQDRNPPGLELRANRCPCRLVQVPHRLLQRAIAHCSRSHHQHTVRDGLRHSFVFLRLVQQFRRAHCRPSLAESLRKWIHQPQPVRPEIAHGPGRGPNVQRIPRAHQHHDETV